MTSLVAEGGGLEGLWSAVGFGVLRNIEFGMSCGGNPSDSTPRLFIGDPRTVCLR